MKRLLALAGSALALLCAAFFLHGVASHWDQIRAIPLDGRTAVSFALAVVLYAGTYLAAARSWQLVLRLLRASLGYRHALRILATSQFAKYLPGNVAHHVGRVVLAQRAGIRAEAAVASLALDTGLVVAAAATCTLSALPLLRRAVAEHGTAMMRNLALLALAAIVLAGLALLVRPLRTRLVRGVRAFSSPLAPGQRGAVAEAFLQYVLNFVLGAAALGVLLAGLTGTDRVPWGDLLGVYAIAWLVGFLVPGAPAGIGIRESLLTLGLSPALGADVAVAATALFRFATVIGDGLVFAAGMLPARGANAVQAKADDV